MLFGELIIMPITFKYNLNQFWRRDPSVPFMITEVLNPFLTTGSYPKISLSPEAFSPGKSPYTSLPCVGSIKTHYSTFYFPTTVVKRHFLLCD